MRAYAIAGSFDDCQRLVKAANSDADLLQRVRLTSANSINIGRLLPQMVYYFHAVAQLAGARLRRPHDRVDAERQLREPDGGSDGEAGRAADRAVRGGHQRQRHRPAYLATGRFEPRASIHTLANAMDVGNPSNFDRMVWLYGGDLEAMRRDVVGSRHDDDEVRATIRRVYDERGYLLDPHSAIGYRALKSVLASAPAAAPHLPGDRASRQVRRGRRAHRRPSDRAAPDRSVRRSRARGHIMRLDATLDALRDRLTTDD